MRKKLRIRREREKESGDEKERHLKGKSHCTAKLLLILFGFSCFAYIELAIALLVCSIQTSQTGGQPYSDSSPYGECSLEKLTFERLDRK